MKKKGMSSRKKSRNTSYKAPKLETVRVSGMYKLSASNVSGATCAA